MGKSGWLWVWYFLLAGLLLGPVNCGPAPWEHDLGPIRISADGKKLIVADLACRQNPWAPTVSIAATKRQILIYNLDDLRAEPVRIEFESAVGPGIRTALLDDPLMLALSRSDDPIALWKLSGGRHDAIQLADEDSPGNWGLAFSPDGAVLAVGNLDGSLQLWDVESLIELADQMECDAIYSVQFSPDGGRLAVGCTDEIHVYSFPDLELINSFPAISSSSSAESAPYVMRMAISPTGDLLASSDSDGAIALWELPAGIETPLHEPMLGTARAIPAFPASALTFSPDGARVGAGGPGTVKIWDVSTRQPVLSFEAHSVSVDGVAFSPNGETLVTSSGCGSFILCTGGDNTIRFWEADTGRRIAVLRP